MKRNKSAILKQIDRARKSITRNKACKKFKISTSTYWHWKQEAAKPARKSQEKR